MILKARVFQGHDQWKYLCAQVTAWVSANVKPEALVSISMSEPERVMIDTIGTIVVWYWADEATEPANQ
jgi:hypothetical protein